MNASIKRDVERGKRLKALRKRANLTQQQVADRLGTDKSSVSRWETGEVFPREFLRQLTELYSTDAAYITFGTASADDMVTYPAFEEFVAWLRASPFHTITPKWMLEAMRTMRMDLPADTEPSVETYKCFHQGLLTMSRRQPRR